MREGRGSEMVMKPEWAIADIGQVIQVKINIGTGSKRPPGNGIDIWVSAKVLGWFDNREEVQERFGWSPDLEKFKGYRVEMPKGQIQEIYVNEAKVS